VTVRELVVSSPGRLDRVIAAVLEGDASRARIIAWIRAGAVRVEGAVVVRPSTKIRVGMSIRVEIPEPVAWTVGPEDIDLEVVYQDEDVAVVNKPAGMVVHPGPGHPCGTLVNALLHHLDGLSGVGGVLRPGIVHRLDKGTSGLLVVAKHDAAHQALAGQFADRTAGRNYLALCHGVPSQRRGTMRSKLRRHPTDRIRFASGEEGREAITDWMVVGKASGLSLVECKLRTGRTHQIRVHMLELGHPLVGDPTYRRRKQAVPAEVGPIPPDRPMLHAWVLRFDHPTSGDPMRFSASLPEDMAGTLVRLGLACPGGPALG
jgi:23S rRNA pseudouridine1911/1915/1917 synthase